MSEDLGELERTRVLCGESVRNPMESVHNLLVVNCSVGQGGKDCKRFGVFTVRSKPSRRLGESEDVLKESCKQNKDITFFRQHTMQKTMIKMNTIWNAIGNRHEMDPEVK